MTHTNEAVHPAVAARHAANIEAIDAIAQPLGIARALSRALTEVDLDADDRGWIEVAIRTELERADMVLRGKS